MIEATDDLEILRATPISAPNLSAAAAKRDELSVQVLMKISATILRIADSLEVISGALCQQYIEAAETDPPKVKKPKKVKKGKKK